MTEPIPGPYWIATHDGTCHTMHKDFGGLVGLLIEGHWTDDCPEHCPYRREKEMAAKHIATWFACEVGAGWVLKAPDPLPTKESTDWHNFLFSFTKDPMKAQHHTEAWAKEVAWLLGGTVHKFVVESDKFHIENLCASQMKTPMCVPDPNAPDPEGTVKRRTFGWALDALKDGMYVYRRGWNGPGQYLGLQVPGGYSKMTLPYIYIVTVQNDLVPWLASQTDMLADDWEPMVRP